MTGRNRDRHKRRNRRGKATAWQRAHCIECWQTPDHCAACPCHEDDEGSDCD